MIARTLLARIHAVSQAGPDACWEWDRATDRKGYGSLGLREGDRWRSWKAHRAVYEALIGPIPTGLTLDHLCRNRRCVNPKHLEPVTHRVNILRGEGIAAVKATQAVCLRGHNNWRYQVIRKTGRTMRVCRDCHRRWNRESARRSYAAKKEARHGL